MLIRAFQFGDEPALRTVYHSAIHQIACRDYTPEQIAAWSPENFDPEAWARRIRGINPFVVEIGAEIVGYADVQTSGYIDHFFVSGAHPRRGIGSLLMARIHEEAARMQIPALTSDVSLTAQPFFAHFGFHIVEQRAPIVRGVTLHNALMCKELALS
ncbi:GNAT family N-acetyltransferase [Glaciimonas sp. GG7]